jgi:hypothetical protein
MRKATCPRAGKNFTKDIVKTMKTLKLFSAVCLSLTFFVGCGAGVEDLSTQSNPEEMTIEDESAAMKESYEQYDMDTGESEKKK